MIVQCCPGECGAVKMNETVARLVIVRPPPAFEPFRRSEIFPQKLAVTYSNDCGDKDGCSVFRCDTLSDNQLVGMSDLHAQKKPGRKGKGAVKAHVDSLRSIKPLDDDVRQVVFVYDDPRVDEVLHAVIRGCEKVPKAEQSLVIEEIRRVFSVVV
jgi:hypothetical protein